MSNEIPNGVWGITHDPVWGTLDQKKSESGGIDIGSIILSLQPYFDLKSDIGHTHDTRYYTQTEVDTKLSGFCTESEVDDKLSGKADASHTHDDRYYTETEIDTKLSGKADASHDHDGRYYTESETDVLLSGKADISHGHTVLLDNSANKITTIADDTTANWAAVGNCVCFYGKDDQITDKPSNYGFLVNMCRGGDISQLWFVQASGKIFRRSGNSAGWSESWVEVFSGKSVVPIANGGTNAATAADALTNLGAAASNHTHNTIVDAGNSAKTISFQYSGSGITTTSWFAAWNDYKLMAISPANARTALGAAASNHNHDGSYVNISGDTMTGALNLANNTWNKIGDDAQMGDVNQGGCIGIQGLNADTGIKFVQRNGTAAGILRWNGSKFSVDKPIESSPGSGAWWIRGVNGESAGLHVKRDALNVNHWIPAIAIQTKAGGGWGIGTYDNENIYFVYGTKANIDSDSNQTVQYTLDPNGNFSGKAANVTGIVGIGNGGTNANTVAGARRNLYGDNLNTTAQYLIGVTQDYVKGGYVALPLPLSMGGTGGDDSGWKTLTSSYCSGNIYVRRIGSWVQLTSDALKLKTALTASTGVSLLTLETTYRPGKMLLFTAGCTYDLVYCRVNTNGSISIFKNRNSSSLPTNYDFYLSAMYYV